jgi:hypothetical protein
MQPSQSYWATVATVMPVVALALVVDSRAFLDRLTEPTDRRYRRLLALAYAPILAILAFGEGNALEALQGEEVPDRWAALTTGAITGGMGLLVLLHAFDLLLQADFPEVWHIGRPIRRAAAKLAQSLSKRPRRPKPAPKATPEPEEPQLAGPTADESVPDGTPDQR